MAFAAGSSRLVPGKSHANPTGQGIYFNSLVLAFFRLLLRFYSQVLRFPTVGVGWFLPRIK